MSRNKWHQSQFDKFHQLIRKKIIDYTQYVKNSFNQKEIAEYSGGLDHVGKIDRRTTSRHFLKFVTDGEIQAFTASKKTSYYYVPARFIELTRQIGQLSKRTKQLSIQSHYLMMRNWYLQTDEQNEIMYELAPKFIEKLAPHNCMSCSWFKPKPDPPLKGNLGCRYPGKISSPDVFTCNMWEYEPDISKHAADFKFYREEED
jgi:hypothetical protein